MLFPQRPRSSGTAMRYYLMRSALTAFTLLAAICGSPNALFAQSSQWILRTQNGPSPRRYHAMAYDAARDRTVLFGGFNGHANGETWEWDGQVWALRDSGGTNSPPPRWGHALVYDTFRKETVLFGGYRPGDTNDTWTWNGQSWTQRDPGGLGGSRPSARRIHAMDFDSSRGVAVLFGGQSDQGGFLDDTWEWNGSAWVARATFGPLARAAHAQAFDSLRGVSVLFGGYDVTPNAETWEWNGLEWNLRTVDFPQARGAHAMSFDTFRGVTVMYGGETYEWNGLTWGQVAGIGPPARSSGAMAFDIGRGVAVYFGGGEGESTFFGDTWELCGCSVSLSPKFQFGCPGSSFEIIASVLGKGPFGYQWRRSGFPIDASSNPTATTNTLVVESSLPRDGGEYDCIVTRSCGAFTSASVSLVVLPDLNGDGIINTADLALLLARFGQVAPHGSPTAIADLNGDGTVNSVDLSLLLLRFGQSCTDK